MHVEREKHYNEFANRDSSKNQLAKALFLSFLLSSLFGECQARAVDQRDDSPRGEQTDANPMVSGPVLISLRPDLCSENGKTADDTSIHCRVSVFICFPVKRVCGDDVRGNEVGTHHSSQKLMGFVELDKDLSMEEPFWERHPACSDANRSKGIKLIEEVPKLVSSDKLGSCFPSSSRQQNHMQCNRRDHQIFEEFEGRSFYQCWCHRLNLENQHKNKD